MRTIWMSLKFLLFMSILTGLLYPLLITGIGSAFFGRQARGSLIVDDGKVVGSELIAQKFSRPEYFWPRPSAADYETVPSGASNLSQTSAELRDLVSKRQDAGESSNEMLFASASGLDPHISPESALAQVTRVAKARRLDEVHLENLTQLVYKLTEDRALGIFGEQRVNVLKLNIALDRLAAN